MKLTKFFRAYGRTLVLIVMSLLLVSFLLEGAIRNLFSRWGSEANAKLGEAFGRPVYMADVRRTGSDASLLESLQYMPGRMDELSYHLLQREATEAGVRVGHEQAIQSLADRGISGAVLDRVRSDTNRSLSSIYDAVGAWLAVLEYAGVQMEALGDSMHRVELAYRNDTQEASVNLSVLDAKAFKASVPDATPEEIQAAFDEAKDRFSAHTDDKLEFGYKLPDRVQIEYLTVDPVEIQTRVSVREAEAVRFYEENKTNYTIQRPLPTSQPSDGSPPPEPQFETITQTYEQVKDRVKNDYRAVKAIEEAQRLVNQMQQEARRPWESQPIGDDHYRTSPPPEKIVSFEALRDKHSATYPVQFKRLDLGDTAALQRERGFGQAVTGSGQTRQPAPALAFLTRGLYKPEGATAVQPLNTLEPSPVLIYSRPDPRTRSSKPFAAYFFRVIAVAPSGPPASIDEVRQKIADDLKLSRAYTRAGEAARKLADRAKEVGLDEAVKESAELKQLLEQADAAAASQPTDPATPQPKPQFVAALGPFAPSGPFGRRARFIQHVGLSSSLHKEIFALVDSSAPTPAATRPVALVSNAAQQKFIVAELLEVKPVYAGDFEAQRESYVQRALQRERSTFQQAWFAPDNIQQRVGFVRAAKSN